MEDKYKTLTAPELAAEDAFIRWVIKGENDQQWILWQQNNPELSGLMTEAKQIIKTISLQVGHINTQESNELWNRISLSIHKQTHPSSRKTFSIVRWSVAAAAILALLIWVNTLQQTEKVIALSGENKEISLPEFSHVTLNAGSKVVFNENKFINDRELTLDGEAFFEVNPGSQFTVKTDQGFVTVLGTSFNVISRHGRFEVSCYTGKVSVSSGKKESQIIVAGEKSIKESQQLRKETFTTADKPGWTQGKFTFENHPLSVVVDELERQYNVKVTLDKELKDVRYIGLFEAGNLEAALYTITWPLHLQYKISGNSVIIFR